MRDQHSLNSRAQAPGHVTWVKSRAELPALFTVNLFSSLFFFDPTYLAEFVLSHMHTRYDAVDHLPGCPQVDAHS